MVTAVRRVIGTAPVLVFNRRLAGGDWDFLALENQAGARLATEHLLALGHRRIAFFGGHGDSSSCRQRREGYMAAMSAAGITPDAELARRMRADARESPRMKRATLFERDPSLTAAVCYNDNVALGLMLGLRARGTRPGVEFAITGFDDIPEAALSTPPLTTLSVDPRARGRQAARTAAAARAIAVKRSRRATWWRGAVELVVRGSQRCRARSTRHIIRTRTLHEHSAGRVEAGNTRRPAPASRWWR